MIFASITRFNGFLRNVSTVFKTNEKRYRRFRSKELPKRHLLFRNLLLIRLISIGPRVVQFIMVIGPSGVQFGL